MRWAVRAILWSSLVAGEACGPAPFGRASRAGDVDEAAGVNFHQEGILGGEADPGSSSVFLLDLRFDTGASICSAVLVSPRVLLTAAHCVDPAFHGASAVTVRATNKPTIAGLMQSDMIEVQVVARHPQWNPMVQQSDFDLGALLLTRAPSGTAPQPLLRTPPPNLLGQTLRLVGYGRSTPSDAGSGGVRRAVLTPITGLTAAEFSYGANGATGICSGDSGGPSFLGEAVAGIHSRTESVSCGRGVDMRIDAKLAFIDDFIAAHDSPLCTADGRCDTTCGADPDCPCLKTGPCPPPPAPPLGSVSGGCGCSPGLAPWLLLAGWVMGLIRQKNRYIYIHRWMS